MCGSFMGKVADPLNLSRGNGEALAKPWENPGAALDPLGIMNPNRNAQAQSVAAAPAPQLSRKLNIPSDASLTRVSSPRGTGQQM